MATLPAHDLDPSVSAFRQEVRDWLAANWHGERQAAHDRLPFKDRGWDPAFSRLLGKRGWIGLGWPKAYGGQARSPAEQLAYIEEMEYAGTPMKAHNIGETIVGPSLIRYGTPEQQADYLPSILRGESSFGLGYSESEAGSDLASLRTRATRDGDDWIINGQKIWTSGAHLSDFGIIVVRTDPNVPKHEGLTFFFLDMKSPGIEIRPIHQMSGTRHFNEVFFTDVRVPDAQRLGQVGQGWRVSLTTLMNERLAVGDPARPDVDDLVALSRSLLIDGQPAIRKEAVRERIAEWYARSQGLKFTKFRTITALSRGETPGPENSIHKLVNASKLQDIASYGMDLMGEAGMVIDDDLVEAWGMFQSALLSSPSARIAGGSDEILKNIIAERVLGLPADMRADKGVPFNKVPTGNR